MSRDAWTTSRPLASKARKYVTERMNPDDVQKRFDTQLRRGGVYRHRLDNGNAAITIHSPDEYIDGIEKSVHAQSDAEYVNDGGRDVPRAKHPRTQDQRNFDAAHKLLADDPTTRAPTGRNHGRARRRSTVFVTATVDQLTGVGTTPMTTIDGKPLPRSFVEEIAGDATFIAQIFSRNGELLWQGRKHRLATPAQVDGLISRDRGCVTCGASPEKYVAHHLLPWEAPRPGPTNINNLVLLCTHCHMRLHLYEQTMFYDIATQTWKTRPATPDEIPPLGKRGRSSTTNAPPPPGRYTKPRPWERPPQPGIRPRSELATEAPQDNYPQDNY